MNWANDLESIQLCCKSREERPREHPDHAPGEPEFFGIRPLRVEPSADGVLEATPIDGRPGSKTAWGANAFTMMGMGPGIEPPAAGDIIEVEFL